MNGGYILVHADSLSLHAPLSAIWEGLVVASKHLRNRSCGSEALDFDVISSRSGRKSKNMPQPPARSRAAVEEMVQ